MDQQQLKPAIPRVAQSPVPAPEPPPADGEGAQMSFLEHLDELRKRLTRAVLGLVAMTILSFVFVDQVLAYLIRPYGERLQTLGPTEGVMTYFRVALLSGVILGIPIITWQIWGYIRPALTQREQRWMLLSLPATFLLFLLGAAFAWFLLMPAALNFLSNFQTDLFEAGWTADEYVAFVTALIFWIGLSFEMPLLFFILARLGFVGPKVLRKNWRLAVVGSAVVAALITPTIDPFNMALVMGPLLALYVLSIFLSIIAYRQSGLST